MDVLREKVKEKCEEILSVGASHKLSIKAIDSYLMTLYMDQELNGFSKLSVIKQDGFDGIYFGIQLPGFHGMNGWVDMFIPFPSPTKVFDAYDRAMRGI